MDKSNDSLKELQEFIWQWNKDQGFNTTDATKKFVMLMEEVGELAKATRKVAGLKFANTTTQTNIREELADVQIVLLGLASILNVDLFDAVVEKVDKNSKRVWK